MGTITHKAGRIAVSKVTDVVLKNLDKDREKEILKLVDFIEKYMDGEKLDVDFNNIRKKIEDNFIKFYLPSAQNAGKRYSRTGILPAPCRGNMASITEIRAKSKKNFTVLLQNMPWRAGLHGRCRPSAHPGYQTFCWDSGRRRTPPPGRCRRGCRKNPG